MTTKRKLPPHWYRITVVECPVCGASETYRERVYGPKPKRGELIYFFEQRGCAGGGGCHSWG